MHLQHRNRLEEKGSCNASVYAVLMFDIINDVANIYHCVLCEVAVAVEETGNKGDINTSISCSKEFFAD